MAKYLAEFKTVEFQLPGKKKLSKYDATLYNDKFKIGIQLIS